MKKKIRIILDTNIWISFLITKSIDFIDNYIKQDKIKILFSDELLTEFIDVTSRDKLKKYFSLKDITQLIDLIDTYGEIIEVKSKIDLCRDKKDNFLLSLAKDGKADFLVTGDNDLLTLKTIEKTKIINLSDFKEKKI